MRQSDEALALMNAAMAILDMRAPSAAACHLQNAIDLLEGAALALVDGDPVCETSRADWLPRLQDSR